VPRSVTAGKEDHVDDLRALVAYNRWANARVYEVCLGLDSAALRADAPGTTGSIERTLKHAVGVEDAFLALLRGQDPREALGPGATYYRRDLAWFFVRAEEIAFGFAALLGTADGELLSRPVHVPWFDREFAWRDCLLQALTHSLQHRTQICSVLGARGIEVPAVDYITMLDEAARQGD